jgi:hypothetical protein
MCELHLHGCPLAKFSSYKWSVIESKEQDWVELASKSARIADAHRTSALYQALGLFTADCRLPNALPYEASILSELNLWLGIMMECVKARRQRNASSRTEACPNRGGMKEKYDFWRHNSTLGSRSGADESRVEAL